MKTNYWLIIGTIIATSAVAQVDTNTLPAIPAPASVAPAPVTPAVTEAPAPVAEPVVKKAAPKKKKVVKKISEPTVTLVPGTATVVPPNLNLRGQAGLKGEVVGHLKKGDTVTVISQINLDKHAADEPAQWAKIALPSGTKVWVNSHFVDATTKTVTAKKLNLRGGPGENYSVLGSLEKGASVSELSTKGSWIEIEAPSTAVAYVAAMYLEQTAPAPAPVEPTPPTPVVETAPPVATTVAETAPVVTTPAPVEAATPVVPAPAEAAPVLPPPSLAEYDTNPPPPRVVTHEGYVRPSVSVIAPTYYELYDPSSGNAINYLYASTTNLDLSRYNGAQIMVTGEESLAARWGDTPVLTVQRIFVVNAAPPEPYKRVSSPRAQEQTIRGSKPQQRR
ncbi:MAG TPA: SH3 domain-containing protein [bacterium]|nr:SH3 domain-containing protein [bacterium]